MPRLALTDGNTQPSLVGRIQLLQVLLGLIVYLLAVGGVWWTSTRVSEDYFQKQAVEWLGKLDELGTPLYISSDAAAFSSVQKHVSEFREIAFVRYYSPDGSQILAEYNADPLRYKETPRLSQQQLEVLRVMPDTENPRLFEQSAMSGFLIRAGSPVWVRSIESDGMVGFSLDANTREARELVGFLEVGLDFRHYRGQLIKNIAVGSGVIALLLLLSILAGRKILKRALSPLSDLQKPLARLAAGDVNVKVNSAGPKEIRAISDALNTTINALKERDESLRRLADHDQLTGLLNRHCFAELLEREAVHIGWNGGSSALLFVDLDQFKLVNDTLGHAAGDRLLVQVAERLEASVREQDVVCRFGGDQFTILARGVTDSAAISMTQSLIKVLQDLHFVEDGKVFSICCSVGITIIASDRFTPDELLAQADMACYEAKSQGRNCFSVFAGDNGEPDRMMVYIGWSQKIRHAIDHDDFVLHYQPIINVTSGQPELFEVLLRMPDDGNTMRSPSTFLPVAERFGLMLDIDRWVIRNATKALGKFRDAGRNVTFCINLSGHAFEDPQLISCITDGMKANGLPASSIVFEITEQVAIRYLDSANQRMRELMDLGCRFALDDFGAGFSSLTYIKRLPVDYIKIEGSFVENISRDVIDQSMVKSIVQIAQTTGKQTIAEYVQDFESLQMLRTLGADYAQGFYIGKPTGTLALPAPRTSK
ncbi:MAG: putative bifunctional diguanylate cyclase/phosphodiesterase [Acidiferrobacterales bacterium]